MRVDGSRRNTDLNPKHRPCEEAHQLSLTAVSRNVAVPSNGAVIHQLELGHI